MDLSYIVSITIAEKFRDMKERFGRVLAYSLLSTLSMRNMARGSGGMLPRKFLKICSPEIESGSDFD